jgi:hypothetical protein
VDNASVRNCAAKLLFSVVHIFYDFLTSAPVTKYAGKPDSIRCKFYVTTEERNISRHIHMCVYLKNTHTHMHTHKYVTLTYIYIHTCVCTRICACVSRWVLGSYFYHEHDNQVKLHILIGNIVN